MPDIDGVTAAFHAQARACRDLGSPFTARLCEILADRLDRAASAFARRVFAWDGDPRADALALRACGALNRLVRSGAAPELARLWPPHTASEAVIADALAVIVPRFDRDLTAALDGPPQTNEVARSAVVLGGALHVAAATGLPLALMEIGASAGINLGFDRHAYDLADHMPPRPGEGEPAVGKDEAAGGDGGRRSRTFRRAAPTWGRADAPVRIACAWSGVLPPLDAPLSVVERAGCDRAPVDAGDPADRERLLAYVWPDQGERLARTAAALAVTSAAGIRVEAADAADWIEERLRRAPVPGRARLVFHTVVWQYLPEAMKGRIITALEAAGSAATAATPLARLGMEAATDSRMARVSLTLWPGGETRRIADADWHGRRVEWHNFA